MRALTLVHLKGALDIANLRRWRQACVMVHANVFPRDYPDPSAIEAMIDALTDAFDQFNRVTKKESSIELADDANEFPTLLGDTIDELIKARDSAIDDEEEVRDELAAMVKERDAAQAALASMRRHVWSHLRSACHMLDVEIPVAKEGDEP